MPYLTNINPKYLKRQELLCLLIDLCFIDFNYSLLLKYRRFLDDGALIFSLSSLSRYTLRCVLSRNSAIHVFSRCRRKHTFLVGPIGAISGCISGEADW